MKNKNLSKEPFKQNTWQDLYDFCRKLDEGTYLPWPTEDGRTRDKKDGPDAFNIRQNTRQVDIGHYNGRDVDPCMTVMFYNISDGEIEVAVVDENCYADYDNSKRYPASNAIAPSIYDFRDSYTGDCQDMDERVTCCNGLIADVLGQFNK